MSATATAMVGRQAELQVLREAFQAGREGHARGVVVRGEAGIGKTRLLTEFLADAPRRATGTPPLVIATGQCVDLGPIGAPFTPIRRLLRELHSGVGDAAFRDAARTPTVIATLSTLLPDLQIEASTPPGTGDYVAEAIERLIENLSTDHHLLLVIEDLHWADAATLALLKTLAVTLRGSHVTLVMTYRSDDVGRQHPLRPVLAELDRSRVVTGVQVTRLTRDDIAEQTRLITGSEPDPAVLERMVARSDGVPFFVEELIGLGEADLPDTLRDLVLARSDRLTAATRRVIGVASAGGVHVDDRLLTAVHGDSEEIAEALREAITEGVLTPDGDGYAFRHALIQEAVHDELLAGERLALHRRYAEELQRRVDAGESELAAAAAEQWLAARDDSRAFEATVTAMRAARAEFATAAEAALGERLLAPWDRVPDAVTTVGVSRSALAERVSQTLAAVGDAKRGERIVQDALTHPSDPLERARLLIQAVVNRVSLGVEESPELIEARSLVEGMDTPAGQAALAEIYSLTAALRSDEAGSSAARQKLADRAVAIAESSGDAKAIAATLRRRGAVATGSGRWEGVLDDLVRAAALGEDPISRFTAITNHTDLLIRMGRYREAAELGTSAWEESIALGVERGAGAMVLANVAEAQLALGDADSGLQSAERARALFANDAFFRSFTVRLIALAAIWDDRPADADRVTREEAATIEAGIEDVDELFGWAHVATDRALVAAETADIASRADLVRAAASEAAKAFAEHLSASGPLRVPLLPSTAWALRAAAEWVPEHDTAELREGLDGAVKALREDGRDAGARAMVQAELAGLTGAGAESAWRAALAVAEVGEIPVRHLHHARYRLAELLVGAGDRDGASELLAAIVTEAPRHGVAVVARWARELAARAGIALNGPDVAAHAAPAASGVASLTPRELQVLALVAEGLTNPQIGQRLFISPKTASVHVSAILAKIGAANRAEAAALYAAVKEPAP